MRFIILQSFILNSCEILNKQNVDSNHITVLDKMNNDAHF